MGFRRGFVRELVETLGAVVAAIIAYQYHSAVVTMLGIEMPERWWEKLVLFLGVFVLVMLVITFVGHAVRRMIRAISLGMYDRLCGFVLGAAKGGVIGCVICIALLWVGPPFSEIVSESRLARSNLMVFGALSVALPDTLASKYKAITSVAGDVALELKHQPGYITIQHIEVTAGDTISGQCFGEVLQFDSTSAAGLVRSASGLVEFTLFFKSRQTATSGAERRELRKGDRVTFRLAYDPVGDSVFAISVVPVRSANSEARN